MLVKVGALRGSGASGLVLPNLLRNSSLVAAAAGPPDVLPTYYGMTTPLNGVTRDITTTGTDLYPYMDVNWAGTGSSTSSGTLMQFDSNTAIATAEAERRCASLYLSLTAGALTNVTSMKLRLRYNTAAGALLALTETDLLGVNGTPAQFVAVGGAAPATTAYVVMQIVVNWALAAVNFKLRIQGPMINSGDLPALFQATSP